MRELIINKLYTKNTPFKKVRICSDIKIKKDDIEETKTIWFEINERNEKDCELQTVDAFLIAILPYAFANNFNILVSDTTYISEDLLFQINELLLPSLRFSKDFKIYNDINVVANKINGLKVGTGCGTGFSRGVDSFYTLLKNKDIVNYAFLFNTQAYGVSGGEIAEGLFDKDYEEAKCAIDDYNRLYEKDVKLIEVNTNVHEQFKIRIGYAGTYRDAAIAVLFRPLIGKYLYSTTHTINDFSIGYCRQYENWILPCLSSQGQKLYSFGGAAVKPEKIDYISNYEITYDYLQVCRKSAWEAEKGNTITKLFPNCTKNCHKCKLTCMTLNKLGKLDLYKKRFDVDWVYENIEAIENDIEDILKDSYVSMVYPNGTDKEGK